MIAEFGATAWGHAWLRTAEPTRVTRPNPLLPRARKLSRDYSITGLTIVPGQLTATMGAHQVQITVPQWPAETLTLVTTLLADHPPAAPGDLPDTLATTLHRAGVEIAPPSDSLLAQCDCRDRRAHCVHVLVTLYLLVQAVDERPALAVELRGAVITGPADPDWVPLGEVSVAGFYG
ncbi:MULTISPECIES: hypothetical protein [unclassified Crossiella]|uniref:hypothetical protein n=1 Tax=unclassified Crossiella TaxID=2620835 RepID=UPI001FFEAAA6|nr:MULTISPECIES: hypothetical protein [unclassified Crossiella]MCK2239810.1 hypothetical protein [Crossiella sp. S99.2]MCK2252505.1 hypothetical protein [Crossiella sp. S99.1]